MVQHWDPLGTNSNNTLSANQLIVYDTGGNNIFVPSFAFELVPANSFIYWELTATGTGFSNGNSYVGVANKGAPIANGQFLGVNPNTVGVTFGTTNGTIFFNNANVMNLPGLSATALIAAGGLVCQCVDFVNGFLYYIRIGPNGLWNGNAAANPSTQSGAYILQPPIPLGLVVPAVSLFNSVAGDPTPDTVLGRFATESWLATPPANFGPFDPPLFTSGGTGMNLIRPNVNPWR